MLRSEQITRLKERTWQWEAKEAIDRALDENQKLFAINACVGSGKKEELIKYLKELNFDGFVNFEHVKDFYLRRKSGSARSFSGIGLFNLLKFFKQGKQYKGFSEISKIPKVKTDIENELRYVKIFAEDKFDQVSSKKDLINLILLSGVNKYLVSLDDIESIVNNIDSEKLQERFKLESHRKTFRLS